MATLDEMESKVQGLSRPTTMCCRKKVKVLRSALDLTRARLISLKRSVDMFRFIL